MAETEWQTIESAPQNATWVEVKLADGSMCRAHWACDLSGEEQPPFRGWFEEIKDSTGKHLCYRQIDNPTHWRPTDA